MNLQYQQSVGTTSRAYVITYSSGYLNNATAFDQSMPDLTALTGWQAVWNLVTGTAVNWTFSGASFTGTTGVIMDGLTLTVGVRTGSITP